MNGDITGYSDGTAIVFDAQRGITAAEAAVMLSNFLAPSPPPRSGRLYSRLGVRRRVKSDILRRVSGRQRLCGVLTRAEAAQMLLGAYELLQKR